MRVHVDAEFYHEQLAVVAEFSLIIGTGGLAAAYISFVACADTECAPPF